MRFLIKLLPLSAFAPLAALAQGDFTGVSDFTGNFVDFINGTLIPLIFALAFLVFLWGVAQYFIFGAGDEGKRETGRTFMLYGIIGFVVMVSVWGIVNIFSSGLGLEESSINSIPSAGTI